MITPRVVVRIEKNGMSFRGAGSYYLHDKAADKELPNELKPSTTERVWFTEVRNCLSQDAETALDEMWHTADAQQMLKMQAGVRTSGRPVTDPVKTISLSWHPDFQPSRDHMIEAADQFLKHLGWDEHQAVYVAHNDTKHRHIHIVLNRIHPEHGRTLDDYKERERAQVWRLQYERTQEKLRTTERETGATEPQMLPDRVPEQQPERYEALRDYAPSTEAAPKPERHLSIPAPGNDHLPHNVIDLTRPMQQAFEAQEAVHRADVERDRHLLKVEQRAEREAFFKDGKQLFKATRHAVYDQVRQTYRSQWKDYYAAERKGEMTIAEASQTGLQRALYFAKQGQWQVARNAFGNRHSVRDAIQTDLRQRKAALKATQRKDLRLRQHDATEALLEVRKDQYALLLQEQRETRAAQKAGATLDDLGYGADRAPAVAANTNSNHDPARDAPVSTPTPNLTVEMSDAQRNSTQSTEPARENVQEGTPPPQTEQAAPAPDTIERQPRSGVSDLAAGALGSAMSYLADAIGDLLAPTPPEVRERIAKDQDAARQKQDSERAPPRDDAERHARAMDAAVQMLEEERARLAHVYWEERDRNKGWERDQ